MDVVRRQYETYPYPERDPADESTRLIEGSPSHPVEIDHFLFGGSRDWSRPFRALVAGGGTGDGLIMLAQKLADIGCPAEIVYLDMSQASREVAEARAAARGLGSIRFLTGDLLTAPDHGPFDYIDCCGVLHHLPDPDAGFRALADALAPEGGVGLMVYAPLGRTGVYPLQSAFGALFEGDAPAEKVALAKVALDRLPPTNWLGRNPFVGDHKQSDAGLYDLLLHGRDRAYRVNELTDALDRAGLGLVSLVEPARYDPLRYLPDTPQMRERVARLSGPQAAAVAENLAGNIKTHVAYATRAGREGQAMARPQRAGAVPRLAGVAAQALAAHVAKTGELRLTLDGLEFRQPIPKEAARLIAGIDGRRSLRAIAEGAGIDWLAFASAWMPVHRALAGFNLLHYSEGARR
ncbi:class I SAM-dependent methyltransferase [Limibaculum sp. M0105]|uniref:Class I SAM-dependent methyltransferase n=1 Tax=Thermohalobaculum xanthum TaxID=2753746 RepID=A0A8J7M5X3_9RHOB|nr:class I SAM-dependent methyltransferase [Thermohalobaculum xanthum]MBK0398800.1 class I SAM-dependent methyltransferase [Thermohalobaculum xanthum]